MQLRKVNAGIQPPRVFVVCPGLGLVSRGYETFARECFDALSDEERVEMYLFKGAGVAGWRERSIWNLNRDSKFASIVGTILCRDGYYAEQMTFLVALLLPIARLQPEVIFFSDVNLRTPLWHWRRLTGQSYRLLLSNGGPVGPPFPRCEHVHQVLPGAVEEATLAGHPSERQTFVPYGFDLATTFSPLTSDEKCRLKAGLGLPLNRAVILSVGALNASHKRMDYVIREVASLPSPRPFLLLLGAAGAETPAVLELGDRLLGPSGYAWATVPQDKMSEYYQAADSFVLASLFEGFGRAYVEALSHGLPCLAHDYPGARFILHEHGIFGDFRQPGTLTKLLVKLPPTTEFEQQARHRFAYERFGWHSLRDGYVSMFQSCAAAPLAVV